MLFDSSVSSGVNAMTTVTMEDIIKPLVTDKITDDGYLRISKGTRVVAMAYRVESFPKVRK